MAKRNPNRIHELRIRRKWNQPELAERVGAHWVTISKLERGQMQLTQDWMERLAAALGVRPAELIADAPLVRTIYATGTIQDRGLAEPNLEVERGKGCEFDIELGVHEPDRTEWYFINTDAYYPVLSNGDLVRFTYVTVLEPKNYIGRLCLVELDEINSKKFVGVLETSADKDRYNLQIASGPPMRGIIIYDLAVASMAIMQPEHIVDEDGIPLP